MIGHAEDGIQHLAPVVYNAGNVLLQLFPEGRFDQTDASFYRKNNLEVNL